jgi:hypothetical protein
MTTRRISSTKQAPARGTSKKAPAQKTAKKTAPKTAKKTAPKTAKKPVKKAAKKPTPKKATKKKDPAKKSAPKRAAVKKVAAKKSASKKASAKKTAPKKTAPKAPAKKSVSKRVSAKKTAPRKVVAKKAVVRKAAARRGADPAVAKGQRRRQAQPAIEAAKAGSLVNHIAFVVDRSGSMRRIRAKVVQVFNAQLAALLKSSKESGQQTFVSFYTFQSNVDAPRFFARPIDKVDKLTALSCTGLFDAVGQSIVDLGEIDEEKLDNVSFLVVVLTDGHENHSRRYKAKLKDMIVKAQGTGRWTFAFLVPKGGESVLKRFGIPQGNIQTWQTTTQGLRDLGQDMQRGLQTFYTARQKGQRAVVGVFTTHLTGAAKEAVSTALSDASDGFLRIPVRAASAIRELVESELGAAGSYHKGHAYYELTKPELVQESKEIAIVEQGKDGAPGKIYVGDSARALLGLPVGERFRVKPGDHGGFSIFVQSTSVNRRLVAGTTLLYRKDPV